MANIQFGGDPESYMEAPRLSASDGDGGGAGSLIANILDLLGIHKQVAKGEKKPKQGKEESAPAQNKEPQGQAAMIPVLDSLEQEFQPQTPLPTDFGRKYLQSIRPLGMIDPNDMR